MLTKTDFFQIKTIVQKETRDIVRKETKTIIRREIAPIKKDIKIIKSNVNMVIDHFDVQVLDIKGRVEKIEDHLGFTASPS